MSFSLCVKNISSYDIKINSNFDELNNSIFNIYHPDSNKLNKKICIITDENVSKHYLDTVKELLLQISDNVFCFVVKPGEENKSLETVKKIYSFLVDASFERSDLLVALGGGIVGDMVGFTAASYLRGIDFIQVPTSLLSQVDSSIGGKTGVNLDNYKNMVGAFYNPKLVYINTGTLKTLPSRELSTGMAEIIKHSLIKDKKYYAFIKENASEILSLNPEIMTKLIYESCKIKRDVVENDFKEQGERALLNFGHTVGHALEKDTKFSLTHGECVALGMCAALNISVNLSKISDAEMKDAIELISKFNLPVKHKIENHEGIISSIHHDKKNVNGKLKFIILDAIGKGVINTAIDDSMILDALKILY